MGKVLSKFFIYLMLLYFLFLNCFTTTTLAAKYNTQIERNIKKIEKKEVNRLDLLVISIKTKYRKIKNSFRYWFNRLNYEFGGILSQKTYKKGTKDFANEYKPFLKGEGRKTRKKIESELIR